MKKPDYTEINMCIKFPVSLRNKLKRLAEESSRTSSNYVKWLMSEYIKDHQEIETTENSSKRLKGSKHVYAAEEQTQLSLRLPKTLKEEFYRIAELQGYKGSSLIKILLQKEN